jgi:hypothetical protein
MILGEDVSSLRQRLLGASPAKQAEMIDRDIKAIPGETQQYLSGIPGTNLGDDPNARIVFSPVDTRPPAETTPNAQDIIARHGGEATGIAEPKTAWDLEIQKALDSVHPGQALVPYKSKRTEDIADTTLHDIHGADPDTMKRILDGSKKQLRAAGGDKRAELEVDAAGDAALKMARESEAALHDYLRAWVPTYSAFGGPGGDTTYEGMLKDVTLIAHKQFGFDPDRTTPQYIEKVLRDVGVMPFSGRREQTISRDQLDTTFR